MVSQVGSGNRAALQGQGYAFSEWRGFDDHWIPLYTHKPVSDKRPGDVIANARVGDPKNLNDGEATYLARKASQGFFPWSPGEECLSRTFREITVTQDGLGRTETHRSDPVKGCKWCRKYAAQEDVASGEENDNPPPAPSRTSVLKCDMPGCKWRSRKNAKSPAKAFAAHMRKHERQKQEGSASGEASSGSEDTSQGAEA